MLQGDRMRAFRTAWVVALAAFSWISPAMAATTCNKSFAEVFRDAAPAVVRVFAVKIDPFSLPRRVQFGGGSGVVVDHDGHVVTNAHIVYEANEIMVAIHDEDLQPAEIVGLDLISDVAVIKLHDHASSLTKARLAEAPNLSVGEDVLAIGFPLGIGKTATRGIISGLERVVPLSPMSWLAPLIQTDAAISPGSSGGPLMNRCGEVIAISSFVAQAGQNINFAVPITIIREIAPQLIMQGRVIRAWHGIHGRLVPPALIYAFGILPGFLVETIEPGSPAEKIGLRGGSIPVTIGVQEYLLGGDVISKVNDDVIADIESVTRIARSLKVGDTIRIEFWRDGQLYSVTITLPERPTLPGDAKRFH